MTDQTPEDWVLIEAAKRCGWTPDIDPENLRLYEYEQNEALRALCDMIAKHEQKPIDRKVLCARRALREVRVEELPQTACVRAIELWEEGFGK